MARDNTDTVQKFKVRIEDPPRRRHMVFLGGAVLANIVRSSWTFETLPPQLTYYRWRTGRTCGFQRRNGRSRVSGLWRSLVRGEQSRRWTDRSPSLHPTTDEARHTAADDLDPARLLRQKSIDDKTCSFCFQRCPFCVIQRLYGIYNNGGQMSDSFNDSRYGRKPSSMRL